MGHGISTFFTSNRFLPSSAVPPDLAVFDTFFESKRTEGPASGMSTSMVDSYSRKDGDAEEL